MCVEQLLPFAADVCGGRCAGHINMQVGLKYVCNTSVCVRWCVFVCVWLNEQENLSSTVKFD